MSNPVTAEEFEGLMRPLAPFEAAPKVAIAVSGGRDSIALAFLCDRWVKTMGGEAVLLTVDHGLRAESANEAEFVADWAANREIACQVLRWEGDKPSSAVQQAARDARYTLMEDWCRKQGIVHLFLAHHGDDQGETLLMRLSKGSGAAGLAAMAPITETRHLRLLRPLLSVSRTRLEDTLAQQGMDWVEDPSNADPKYERTLVRKLSGDLTESGLDGGLLSALAGDFAALRQKKELEVVEFLAQKVTLHPTGYVYFSSNALGGASEGFALAVLGRILRTVGGGGYSPSQKKMARLWGRLGEPNFTSATLGRCRIMVHRNEVLVFREARNLPAPMKLSADEGAEFDGRFYLKAPIACRAAPLGVEGWKKISSVENRLLADIPASIRGALPAFWDDLGLLAVPPLRYWRDGMTENLVKRFQMSFRPPHPLNGIGLRLL